MNIRSVLNVVKSMNEGKMLQGYLYNMVNFFSGSQSLVLSNLAFVRWFLVYCVSLLSGCLFFYFCLAFVLGMSY